jgi:hypothetical protein
LAVTNVTCRSPPVAGAQAEDLDLPDGADANQGIAALERVVEEGEGPVALQRDEPEGELGHLHGHRVDVHAVEAAVRDYAASDCARKAGNSISKDISGKTLHPLCNTVFFSAQKNLNQHHKGPP